MAEPKEGYNSGIYRVVSSGAIDSDGDYVVGGATLVADSAVSQYSTYILSPDDGEAADVDAERINDVFGIKKFRLTVIPGDTSSVTAFILGYSTDADDLDAINNKMTQADAEIGAPDGQQIDQTIVLVPFLNFAANSGLIQSDWIVLSGDPAKTLAVRTSGADYATGVIVEALK